jgi:hypothetical protein
MTSSSHVYDDSMSVSLPSNQMRATNQMDSDSFPFHTWTPSAPSASGDIETASNGKLIEPSSPHCRSPSRLPSLLPPPTQNLNTHPVSAISYHLNNNTYNPNSRQDVPALSSPVSYTTPSRQPSASTSVENPRFLTPDESLNNPHSRPRTSTKLFPLLPDLAAHYGIPQLLPPAPRPTPRKSSSSSSTSNDPPEKPVNNYEDLCTNYLNMLSQQPDDTLTSETSPIMDSLHSFDPPADQAAQSVYEFLSGDFQSSRLCSEPTLTQSASDPSSGTASPLLFSPDYPMSEYLTSPVDDSPQEDMLTTPHLGSEMLTSPLLTDTSDSFDMDLFGGLPLYEPLIQKDPSPTVLPGNVLDLDSLYSMSPVTPALNPASLYTSPHMPTSPSFHDMSSTTRRKSAATGTRKNVTPDSLVPLDAPTQPRKYAVPSATSRKALPAVFAKKRARSQAFAEDEEEAEEPLHPNATELEQIEWKRRQNTLAARKSRKRKLMHQIELEETVKQLTEEKETWRVRALTYQALLKNHGHEVPEFA